MNVCVKTLLQSTTETTCQSEYELMAHTKRDRNLLFVCFKVFGLFFGAKIVIYSYLQKALV